MRRFLVALLVSLFLVLVSGQILFAQSNATNYLPKFTNAGGTTTNSSVLYQNGVNIGLGTAAPLRQLHIHNSTYQDCSAVITQSGTGTGTGTGTGLGLMAGNIFRYCSSSAIQLTNYYSGTTNADGFLIDLTNTDASIRLLETGNLSLYTGTGSNLALRLSESNVSIGNDKFYLNSAGNLGIGTISPSQKLHVAGNSYITGNLGLGTAPTTNKLSVVGSSLFDGNATIGATGTYSSSLYVNGACKIQRHADADYGYEEALRIKVNQNFMQPISVYQVNSSGTEIQTFRVYGNGSGFFAGRVGIGTTAYPAEMLHVVGNSYITGNVGIGTQNTFGYKLAVNGDIGARKVIAEVTSAWPDYVFEGEYKLQTIKELEKYISVNKHLPEIPTAKEIQENGQDLGEMNTKLLQKVEELTLYIIEQQKQIDIQQQNIASQQKAIEEIRNSLK